MQKILLLSFTLLCLLQACGSKTTPKDTSIPIIPLDEAHFIEDGASLIEESSFITLSTTDPDGLFSSLDQLMFAEDTLIIYNNDQQKIFFYDKEGNFLHAIHKRGKGPGEYLFANDILYQDGLYILDGGTSRIHRYSLSRAWLGSQPYDRRTSGTSFAKNDSAFIFYRNGKGSRQIEAPQNFASFSVDSLRIIDSASLIVPEIQNRGLYTSNPFSRYQNEIYALPPFEDVIYRMDADGKIDSAFLIEVPQGQRLTEEPDFMNTEIKEREFMRAQQSFQSIYFYGSLQITDRHVIFGFRKKQEYHYCLYDKTTGASRYFNGKTLTSQEGIFLSLLAVQGDDFYFKIYADTEEQGKAFVGDVDYEDLSQVLYKVKLKSIIE